MTKTGQITFNYTVFQDDDKEVLQITCDYLAEHDKVECSNFKAVDFDGCEIWDCLKSNTKFFIQAECERVAVKAKSVADALRIAQLETLLCGKSLEECLSININNVTKEYI